ncbi:MAG: diphthamide synthesis protein [Nanoarchaeota archaeon]|nr:diphthamide synthesis protein [Nanoarchaeota archaeon]
MRTLKDLEEYYKLDLDKALKEIKKEKAKRVLIQFPDGLKHYALAVVDYLEEKTGVSIVIYLGSCFGACDTPQGFEKHFDLMIQFGHNSLMPSYLKN